MITQIKNKLSSLALFSPVMAVEKLELAPQTGTFGTELTNLSAAGILSGAISLVMLVVALVFFFMLVLGGLKWVMSGGDQKAVEAARNQITNALIGLAIVFAAFAIMKIIGIVFGIDLTKELVIPTFIK